MDKAQILPFITNFNEALSESLRNTNPSFRLTKCQYLWLSFCMTGILLTNKICWSSFHRNSFGGWGISALSWMFRQSKINWELLLESSIRVIVAKYGITKGTLGLDETDRERSKNAKKLFKLGKQKDKKSGGYFNGQCVVVLLLVTDTVSIPVGFGF